MALALSTDRIARMELRAGESRGQAIDRRMNALGWTVAELYRQTGVSRTTIYKAMKDDEHVKEASYAALEAALDRAERSNEQGAEPAGLVATEAGYVEFEVTGDFGVRVVVKGPIENAAELERSVAQLIRDIRAGGESTP